MTKRTWTMLGIGVVLSTLAAARFGGWAVVSVENVPDHWQVGKPLQLAFQVRQHGQHHIEGLHPVVQATSGSRTISAVTWEFREDGVTGYRARLNFPRAGDWQVRINSGFGNSRAVLLPWRVVDSSAAEPAALSKVERGRRLFAAKGCVTCHVHNAVDVAGDLQNFGPDLTTRRFGPGYLEQFLANPSIKPASNGSAQMPNPRLKDKDIAPLVAFINSDRRLSSR
ncbi:MAG: c-type cytochrome [Gemmatimonadaceae bacterium]